MGTSSIFVVTGSNALHRLHETPFDCEDDFQTLLERYPDLLPGDQIDPDNPRRWLLVTREASIADTDNGAGRWAVDHFFVDQEGVPTFVEVKRRGDTRLRREVVGQMFDYAAHAVAYWPEDDLYRSFEATVTATGNDPDSTLLAFLGEVDQANTFWDRVWANLRAGKLRLIFVADTIPPELQRVIEFLNVQMNPAEVLGVELRRYVGDGIRTLVPRVIGKTAQASGAKRERRPSRSWDRDSVLAELMERDFPDAASLAQRLLDWAEANPDLEVRFGRGPLYFSFTLDIKVGEQRCAAILIMASERDGLVGCLQFAQLMKFEPFESLEMRSELMQRFQEIDSKIDTDNLERYPMFRVGNLSDAAVLERFQETVRWVIEAVKYPTPTHPV